MVEFVKHLKILQLHMWKCGFALDLVLCMCQSYNSRHGEGQYIRCYFCFFEIDLKSLLCCFVYCFIFETCLFISIGRPNTSLLYTVHCKMATQSYLIITVIKSQCMTKCDLWSNCKCCKAQAKYGEEYHLYCCLLSFLARTQSGPVAMQENLPNWKLNSFPMMMTLILTMISYLHGIEAELKYKDLKT